MSSISLIESNLVEMELNSSANTLIDTAIKEVKEGEYKKNFDENEKYRLENLALCWSINHMEKNSELDQYPAVKKECLWRLIKANEPIVDDEIQAELSPDDRQKVDQIKSILTSWAAIPNQVEGIDY